MFTATMSSLWARKRRLAGASIAVIVGVAFLAATLVLGDSMRSGFNTFFADANRGTDVFVRNDTEVGSDDSVQQGTLDAAVADAIAVQPGVARVAVQVDGVAQLVGADGDAIGGDGPPTLGSNWIDDSGHPQPGFNGYRIAEGRAPAADDEVVIDRGSATDGDLHVGDRTTVLTPSPTVVTVVGIVTFGDDDNIGGSTYTGFTLAAAQRLLLAEPDRISSILVQAADDVSPAALVEQLAPVLPHDAVAITGAQRTAEENAAIGDDFLDFFEAFLLAFAVIALLVATFSIHNTFSILVAQRTRESALMRALGASRLQVLGSVTIESIALGAVASAAGLGAGIGLAALLKWLMDIAGFGLPSAIGLSVEAGTIVAAITVGLIVTVIASVTPAIKAARVAPLAAMRDVAIDRSARSVGRAVIGLVLLGGGVATIITATSSADGALARAGLGALATMIGAVVSGPVIAGVGASLLGAPIALLRGTTGRLARANAVRNPKRSAGTASALMIGTAVVALFATFGASMKASLDDLVEQSFAGDLVIAQNGFSGAPLPVELTPAVAELDSVRTAVALSNAPIVLDGRDEIVMATDFRAFAAVADLDDDAGHLRDVSANGAAVSAAIAEERGWSLGDHLPVRFADGGADEVVIEAIYGEANIVGDILIANALWQPHQGRSGDAVVLIDLAAGVDAALGQAEVQAVADRFNVEDVQNRAEFSAANAAEIDQMLGLVYGLLGLAVLIAVLGIANTLSLSLHERTRELGLLRAVGQSRRALRSTVRWESVIIAIFGTVGGLLFGTFLGWGVVRAMKAEQGLGVFAAPVPTLAVILVLAAVAGVVAAVRPARRAARLDILAAIATN